MSTIDHTASVARTLRHYTIDTGHMAETPIVTNPDILAVVRDHIAEALAASLPIPGGDGYRAKMLVEGATLVVSVYSPDDDTPLITYGCAHGEGAETDRIKARLRLPDAVTIPPPWCIVHLGLRPEHRHTLPDWAPIMHWVADYERCVAAAWVQQLAHG